MRHAIPEEPDLVDMDEHDGDLLAGMVVRSEPGNGIFTTHSHETVIQTSFSDFQREYVLRCNFQDYLQGSAGRCWFEQVAPQLQELHTLRNTPAIIFSVSSLDIVAYVLS
jgi:hypothetical protein